MKIGQGAERAAALLPRLEALQEDYEPIATKKKQQRVDAGRLQRKDAIVGMEGGVTMPLRYAKCCHAQEWPREKIVGNINRFGEVMVHRHHCRMFKNTNPERRIKVWWK